MKVRVRIIRQEFGLLPRALVNLYAEPRYQSRLILTNPKFLLQIQCRERAKYFKSRRDPNQDSFIVIAAHPGLYC